MAGVAAVEFALLLIPMLVLCFGIVEYGRAIYQYNTLAKGVRDAVRLLAQNNPADTTYPTTAARCLAVYGNTACTGQALVPGLTVNDVVICDRVSSTGCPGKQFANFATAIGTINLVEVRISGFDFALIGLPFLGNTDGIINFGPVANTMRQVS